MAEPVMQEAEELHIQKLDLSHLVTEDEAPVNDLFSERQMRLLVDSLYASWRGPGEGRPFVAMANVGLFYHLREPALVPDVLLSLDVALPEEPWEKEHRSYFVWECVKPPDVVIEIVSNKEGKELSDKLLDYARIGVAYYVVYEPKKLIGERPLRVFARQGLRYTELDAPWLDQVGLGLTLWEGEYEGMRQVWLRWCDADGNLLLTGQEAAAEKERQLLAERARAEQERQRAELAEQRAAALAAKLAALGIDPEAE